MAAQEVVILAGHGTQEQEAVGLAEVASRVHGLMHPGCSRECVRIAYLQFIKPDLAGAIDDSVQQGATKIIIHPYFLASGFHVTTHIPRIIADARERHSGVEFLCTAPLGAHEKLAEVVLERIVSAASRSGDSPGQQRGEHE